jgi:hypothetical protein
MCTEPGGGWGDIALAAAQSLLIGCVAIRDREVTTSVRGLVVAIIVPGEPVECTIDGAHIRTHLGMEIGSKVTFRAG